MHLAEARSMVYDAAAPRSRRTSATQVTIRLMKPQLFAMNWTEWKTGPQERLPG